MIKNELYKKILIILLIVVPTVSLTGYLMMNKDKIGAPKHVTSMTLDIQGMFCDSCSKTIEDSFKPVHGVKSVDVDFKTKQAVISYDKRKLDINKIRETIKKAGYSTKQENKLKVLDYKIRYN